MISRNNYEKLTCCERVLELIEQDHVGANFVELTRNLV
jgi:hypothetical protein